MRAVVQRVSRARVEVDGRVAGEIGPGLMVLLGVGQADAQADADWLADKIAGLRVFPDAAGKLNLALRDAGGQVLVVSQFTLWGDCARGNRPGFSRAAAPEPAQALYRRFVERLSDKGLTVATGVFGAMMDVHLTNQGPVTLLIDSEKSF
ncbi:MAG: D-aminoacyl-tRNA deacylase [Thermodesulfobacteriota bacterium]